jgi:hypothetical protein
MRHVKTVLDPVLGFALREGKLEGGLERRRTGCIFPGLEQEVAAQVDDAQMFVVVRVFVPVKSQRSEAAPLGDPLALATLVERIRNTWREHVLEGGVWFSRVVGAEYDLDRNMVELTFMAHTRNIGILP